MLAKPFFRRLVLLLASTLGACATSRVITLLHFNDVYEIERRPGQPQGGFAPLLTLLERERAKNQHTLTTFGGDLLSPSLLSTVTRGAHMIELANAVGVDLAVLGNHELDFGVKVLRTRIAASRFPWLATNVKVEGRVFPGGVETVLRRVGGTPLGFFGLLAPEAATLSSPGAGVRFAALIATARAAVTSLRREGAAAIIALTHLTLDQDRALAREVPGIAAILGGHDHEPMSLVENDTVILKSGAHAEWLGVLELRVDGAPGNARVWPASWRHVSTRGVPGHPRVEPLLRRLRGHLTTALSAPVGRTAVEIDTRTQVVRRRETAFGNLVADAMRAATGAQVALVNGGSIRGNRIYPPGTVLTRGDLRRELPFRNLLAVLEVSGQELLAALEHGVSKLPSASGRFLQVSGLSFEVDAVAAAGHRVRRVRVAGRPVDAGGRYRVVTSDYLAGGGDGFAMHRHAKVLLEPERGGLIVKALETYVRRAGAKGVSPRLEGRIGWAK